MADPTRQELIETAEALGRRAGTFEANVARWKKMHGKAAGALSTTAKVAPFTPIAGMAVTYLTGRGDAMMGTPDVKNPVTIGVGALSWLGSAISAWKGWSIPAVGLGAVATAELGALTHDVGYAAGSESKAAG